MRECSSLKLWNLVSRLVLHDVERQQRGADAQGDREEGVGEVFEGLRRVELVRGAAGAAVDRQDVEQHDHLEAVEPERHHHEDPSDVFDLPGDLHHREVESEERDSEVEEDGHHHPADLPAPGLALISEHHAEIDPDEGW